MELIKKSFEEIKKTRNQEEINMFLIKLSKNPIEDYLNILEYFINNLEPEIMNAIKLNLIFLLGEIGKTTALKREFINFILNMYSTSDRWVRNEIIQTIEKISNHSQLSEDIINLIENALNDEYSPIRHNVLKVLLKLEKQPNVRNIFQILNSKEPELVEIGLEVLIKHFPSNNQLFNSLNTSENHRILKSKAIRTLLLFYFRSIIDLDSFRNFIIKSTWLNDFKEKYLKEIEIYERILLKII
ncbi:hypothetical protein LCGC14_2091940 [marine sediment metagenome]|uniref:Condensin complex subunit 1 C-terminal domain-containing protein n=1 Tax=marine sediment metagenome TaxID=412755 RepID=A0A0F9ECN6_9ZZZZ